MDYFPVFADLHNRPVLVVGGGAVAERKVRLLLAAGAVVTVIAPQLSDALRQWVDEGRVQWRPRRYGDEELTPYRLVYAATNDTAVNRRVYDDAEAAGKLVNAVDQKEICSFISPAIVDRSPVVVAISTGGASPVLARRLRTLVEMQLPQRLGRLATFAAVLRERVKQSLRDLSQRRLFWEDVLDGPVGELVLAGNEAAARPRFDRLLDSAAGNSVAPGTVAIVGAGPGDPGLLTLNALQAMQRADVVLHDKLVSADVLDLCRRDADLVDVGKRAGNHRLQQEQINALLVQYARAGKQVVRLKGGDPFVFGRGGEEVLALAHADIESTVIPGISAANACAAAAKLPLTHRRIARSVTFVTANCQKSTDCIDWGSLSGPDRTLAIYMGVRQLEAIQAKLLEHGLAATTPWAIIENGTRDDQRTVYGALHELAAVARRHDVRAPAVLIVGEATRIARELEDIQRATSAAPLIAAYA